MLRDREFLENQDHEVSERRYDVPEHIEQEEPVEGCTMDFPSWSTRVKRKRCSRGKEKVTSESSVASLGMGTAPNMNPEEMMDTFFANSMQVNVCYIIRYYIYFVIGESYMNVCECRI